MKKRTMKFRFKLLLLAAFLIYAGVTIYGQQVKISALQKQQETLLQTAEEVQTELDRLEHKSEYMNTEEYVENTAREKFGLTYEDEIVIEPKQDSEE